MQDAYHKRETYWLCNLTLRYTPGLKGCRSTSYFVSSTLIAMDTSSSCRIVVVSSTVEASKSLARRTYTHWSEEKVLEHQMNTRYQGAFRRRHWIWFILGSTPLDDQEQILHGSCAFPPHTRWRPRIYRAWWCTSCYLHVVGARGIFRYIDAPLVFTQVYGLALQRAREENIRTHIVLRTWGLFGNQYSSIHWGRTRRFLLWTWLRVHRWSQYRKARKHSWLSW